MRRHNSYMSAINHSHNTGKLSYLHELCLFLLHFTLGVRESHELADYFWVSQCINLNIRFNPAGAVNSTLAVHTSSEITKASSLPASAKRHSFNAPLTPICPKPQPQPQPFHPSLSQCILASPSPSQPLSVHSSLSQSIPASPSPSQPLSVHSSLSQSIPASPSDNKAIWI
ncbi:uncharacterized protein LOC135103323 [Scylla paramamosain]|uniref:uncharacterized protein LOC135103323 n=1 Tax=Scylla paramamosain TaxID=85552 RepID=UPI00308355D8